MNKSEIRKKILKIRKQNVSRVPKFNLKNIFYILKKKKIGKIIGGYYPYNHEVDIIHILEQFEKNHYQISLPKIKKNSQMNFFQWSVKDPLSINKFGIPEPTSYKIVFPNILLVPLVAFDKNLNRVGYSFQKVKKIPINEYDMKLDYIFTV